VLQEIGLPAARARAYPFVHNLPGKIAFGETEAALGGFQVDCGIIKEVKARVAEDMGI
jgi:hypothetical protein